MLSQLSLQMPVNEWVGKGIMFVMNCYPSFSPIYPTKLQNTIVYGVHLCFKIKNINLLINIIFININLCIILMLVFISF
ncbi:MAG: hypothetical protein ACK55I_21590, partial [bacterium]